MFGVCCMFSFFSEVAEMSGLPLEILTNGFRVINFSNKAVYIENFKSILQFQTTEIGLKMKKGMMKVLGQDLVIKNLNENTVLVVGKIEKVENY